METSAVGARGVEPGVVLRPPTDLPFPQSSWLRRQKSCTSGRVAISSGNVPPWSCSAMSRRSWPILKLRRVCIGTPTPCGSGAGAGLTAPSCWKTSPDGAHSLVFPPLDHAVVQAIACMVVDETARPLRRPSLGDLPGRACRTLSRPISRSTVWRRRPTVLPSGAFGWSITGRRLVVKPPSNACSRRIPRRCWCIPLYRPAGSTRGKSTFRWGHERSCPPMILPAGRKWNHGCGSTRTCGTHDYALARGTSRGKNCSSFSTALKPGKWLSARPSQLRRHQGKWPELGPSNPTGICETDHLASPRPRFTPRFWPSDDGRRPVPRL
jgi:hypothetical protein